MIKKTILLIFVVVILQCALSTGVAAQTSDPCLQISTWWFPDPIPPGWFYYAAYPAPFVYLIAAHKATPSCAPPPQQQQTCPKCDAGSPIQLASGNTYIDQTDISLPGLGGGLTLRRRWNSAWPSNQIATSVGIFGSRWRSTYEERVFIDSNNWVTYLASDGSYSPYALYSQQGIFGPFHFVGSYLTFAAYTYITFPNGEQRDFDPLTGALVAIVDPNGNGTRISYDANARLSTVTDPASRHLYFNYPSGSNLVSSVTSDFGVSLSYTYDGQGRLTQITKPDLTTVTLTYDGQSNITAVTDQNGKILESHTYNANGQGLTSSQANGVNALTVTYP